MDRYPRGQFPYSAFFWPALAAASAGEIASSFAAHFLGFSGDADGDHTLQEPEGATPSKIALELQAVRLRDFTAARSGVPTLLCTPLALLEPRLPILPPDTVSSPPSVMLELDDCS
jgi:poly(3-hydroxybutyrate) depolymerase